MSFILSFFVKEDLIILYVVGWSIFFVVVFQKSKSSDSECIPYKICINKLGYEELIMIHNEEAGKSVQKVIIHKK
jgi:hypothetical protein